MSRHDRLGVRRAIEAFRFGALDGELCGPIRGGQGQGASTQLKERGFASAAHVSLRLSLRLPNKPYFHYDGNAGCGINELAGAPGSPLVFIDEVAKIGRSNVFAYFAEIDRGRHTDLALRVAQRLDRWAETASSPPPICRVMHAHNGVALLDFAEEVRRRDRPNYAMGTVLFDPNGYFDDIPFAELERFCREFPRMDLIFNLNMRTYRLTRSHQLADRSERWRNKFIPCPTDLPSLFSRKHLLIQERIARGNPWLLLIMRNMRTSGHSSAGIYPIESTEGRMILERYSEDREPFAARVLTPETQPSLF